jgi:hypothetical protein
MATDPHSLIRVCRNCRLIHDDGETAYERWITPEVYKKTNGMEPPKSRLHHTYCPDCFIEASGHLKAA